MADPKSNLSHEDTIALMNAKATADGDDWWLKVHRRRHIGALPELIATLHNAQVIHAANPETWLPRLAGGGPTFVLHVYHAKTPTVLLGTLQFQIPTDNNPEKSVDPSVTKSQTWAGPRTLAWPPASNEDKQQDRYSISAPPASPSGNSAANNVPGGGSPGVSNFASAQIAQLDAANARIEIERQKLAAEREQMAEERRRLELDAVKTQASQNLKELEARILAAQTQQSNAISEALRGLAQQNTAPKLDIVGLIGAAGGILGPVLAQMHQSSQAAREAQEKSQALALQQQAEQTRVLMTAMLSKPGLDPTIEKMFDKLERVLEKSQAQQVPQSTMLHTMAESMGSMMNMSMELAQTAADLNINGGGSRAEDHPAYKAIREAVKGVSAMMAGYQQSVKQQAAPAQVPNVPAFPQPALPQRPMQQQAQHVVHANGQPPGAPVLTQAPAGQELVPNQPLSIEISETTDVPALLEQMIYALSEPAHVAAVFVQTIGHPTMRKALDEADGEIEEMISRRIMPFILKHPEHVPYLKSVHDEIEKQGAVAGIFEDDDADDDDGSSGDDQDDDNDGDDADA